IRLTAGRAPSGRMRTYGYAGRLAARRGGGQERDTMAETWEISTLDNGLRIVTTPIPSTQSVSVNLFVGVGSRSEPQRINGITHFLEHMVFKGTEKRPDAFTIAQEIEGAGGTLNAYTNKEYDCHWNIGTFYRDATALHVQFAMLLKSTTQQAEID